MDGDPNPADDPRLYRARYEALVNSHADLVSRFTPDGALVFVSPSYCRVVGRSREELLGTSIYDLITAEQIPEVRARLERITPAQPTVRGENDLRSADGTVLRIDWVNAGIFGEDGRLVEVQSVGRDITAQRVLEREVERMASHDQLTGLPNRYLLLDRLETALRNADRERTNFGLLFIDLDGFKAVNDTHGHLAGDELLRQVAARLVRCVRRADTVGRLGGDEFVVLLGAVNRRGAVEVRRKMRAAIGRPFRLDDADVSISASVGVALYPEDATAADDLLAAGDRSMYEVKHARRAARRA